MFKLSRRKGSTLWQGRKRWPADVAKILTGEFTRTTGSADRREAEAIPPLLALAYNRLVQEARDRLADNTQRDMSRAEIHRLAAKHYAAVQAHWAADAVRGSEGQQATIRALSDGLAYRKAAHGRGDFQLVRRGVASLIDAEGLPVPDDSPSRVELERLASLGWMEAQRQHLATLRGEAAPPIECRGIAYGLKE